MNAAQNSSCPKQAQMNKHSIQKETQLKSNIYLHELKTPFIQYYPDPLQTGESGLRIYLSSPQGKAFK